MFQFLMLQLLAEPLQASSGCDAHCLHWNKLTPCQGYYSAVDLYFFCEWCLQCFSLWFLGYLMSMQYSTGFAYICYVPLDRQSQHGSDVSDDQKDAFMLVICTCINMCPIHICGHWPTLMITITALDLRWQHWARPKKFQFCIDQILNWLGNKDSLAPLQYLTVQEARIEIIIIQSSLTPTIIRFKIDMETGILSTKTMSPQRF